MQFIKLLGPSENQSWSLCSQKRKTLLRLLLLSVNTDTAVHQQWHHVSTSSILKPCMTLHGFASTVIGMAASSPHSLKNTLLSRCDCAADIALSFICKEFRDVLQILFVTERLNCC